MSRKTKIIATLGPAVEGVDSIKALISAGMNVARLNFSHGDHDLHRYYASCVREAARDLGEPIALLQDIQGPRVRVGTFPGGAVLLDKDAEVTLRPGKDEGSASVIYVHGLESAHLAPGSPVLLSDGLISLEVQEVGGGEVTARVVEGGELRQKKGCIFPGAQLDIPPVTEKDERDLAFGQEIGVDIVAASFVTTGDDIRHIRSLTAPHVPIIAKIERALGYENLDDILDAADGAMVARGDLGVELSLAIIPRAQKDILLRTNAVGDISITATEMLESMTNSPRPTRAEVTDVANAVLDGTDAVMLSAETAVGKYPARAVAVMDRICREAEASPGYGQPVGGSGFFHGESSIASAIAHSCVDAATNLGLRTIVAFTETGSTARLVSKYRPKASIYAFTPSIETYRRMALYAGVRPMMFDRVTSTDEMMADAERILIERGLAEEGEAVIMAAGVPPNQQASTNLIKIHVVGTAFGGGPQ
jgi:pyruvate kinase